MLLGRTVDSGRVWDIAATAQYLHAKYAGKAPVYVFGEGPAGVLAAYAALWEPEIAGAILNNPPLGHMEADAPALLNVLRVCDIPDVLGMLAPRPLIDLRGPRGGIGQGGRHLRRGRRAAKVHDCATNRAITNPVEELQNCGVGSDPGHAALAVRLADHDHEYMVPEPDKQVRLESLTYGSLVPRYE